MLKNNNLSYIAQNHFRNDIETFCKQMADEHTAMAKLEWTPSYFTIYYQ